MAHEPDRSLAGYIGRTGSGKTTLIQAHARNLSRLVIWDWRGEYAGPAVTRADLPAVLKRRAFRVRVRPTPWRRLEDSFAALAHVVCALGSDLTIVCDEVALVTPDRKEGGVGHILRYARPQGIGFLWATQRPTGIPGILLSESRRLYVFHCDARADLAALGQYLNPDECARVAALPPFEYVTITK